jgi:hypothetical protein
MLSGTPTKPSQGVAPAEADRCRMGTHHPAAGRDALVCGRVLRGWQTQSRYAGTTAASSRAALCILRDEPATNFTYTHPADNRDWMRADQRFLRACGVSPPDVRKDDFTRRGETL